MDTAKGSPTPLKKIFTSTDSGRLRYRSVPRLLMLTSVLWSSVGGTLRADIGTALIPLLVGADGVIQEYRNAVSHLDSGEVLKGIRKIQVLHETVWGNNPQMEADFSDNWRVVRPLSTRIIERLRALPPEHQQMYRNEFGTRARSVLDRALSDMDPEALLRAADLYPLTDVRVEALVAAGDLFFERDQPELAVGAWDLVLLELAIDGQNADREHELSISLKPRLWLALVRAGKSQRAEKLRIEASERGLQFKEISIESMASDQPQVPENPIEEGVIAWKTHNYSQHVAYGTGRGRSYYPDLTGSILTPGIGQDWVAIATSRRLLRYDLRTGKLVANDNLHSGAPYFEEQDPDSRLWATTDGSLLISSYVAWASRREDYLGFDIQVSLPSRAMKCWDVKGDGRLLWDTSDRSNNDEMLRKSSFNSVPVIKDGKVWALGWRKSGYIDVTLWCLDARTGKKIWSRPIVGNQVELTMFGEPAREPILGAILLDDGMIYCCSNLGVIAALRAWDGQVQWIAEYDRKSQRTYRSRYRQPRRGRVWAPNPLVLHDGKLFVTPLDSSQLHAIDAETGSIISQVEGKGLGPHMLGVTDGRLVLFGDLLTSMLASDIGRSDKWNQALTRSPATARPALVKGGVIYISVNESALYQQALDQTHATTVIASLSDGPKQRPGIGVFRAESSVGGRVDVVGDRIILTNLIQATCLTQRLAIWEEK